MSRYIWFQYNYNVVFSYKWQKLLTRAKMISFQCNRSCAYNYTLWPTQRETTGYCTLMMSPSTGGLRYCVSRGCVVVNLPMMPHLFYSEIWQDTGGSQNHAANIQQLSTSPYHHVIYNTRSALLNCTKQSKLSQWHDQLYSSQYKPNP